MDFSFTKEQATLQQNVRAFCEQEVIPVASNIEKENIRHKMNKGRAEFYFDAYIVTDYENKWETRALFYFIKNIFDKFIYKVYTSSYDGEAIRDCTEIENEIRSFLNMNRF